jgi:hypothetical protein
MTSYGRGHIMASEGQHREDDKPNDSLFAKSTLDRTKSTVSLHGLSSNVARPLTLCYVSLPARCICSPKYLHSLPRLDDGLPLDRGSIHSIKNFNCLAPLYPSTRRSHRSASHQRREWNSVSLQYPLVTSVNHLDIIHKVLTK